jgi:hypothetical protein
MKFEIADWRFEVTWDGLLCQPIEREQAKAAKKPAARPGRRDGASESSRHAIGHTLRTFDGQTQGKLYSTGSGSDLVMKESRYELD